MQVEAGDADNGRMNEQIQEKDVIALARESHYSVEEATNRLKGIIEKQPRTSNVTGENTIYASNQYLYNTQANPNPLEFSNAIPNFSLNTSFPLYSGMSIIP